MWRWLTLGINNSQMHQSSARIVEAYPAPQGVPNNTPSPCFS